MSIPFAGKKGKQGSYGYFKIKLLKLTPKKENDKDRLNSYTKVEHKITLNDCYAFF